MPNLARVLELRPRNLLSMESRPAWLAAVIQDVPRRFLDREWMYVPVLADGTLHPAVVRWAASNMTETSARGYAYDVAVYFRFLGERGLAWPHVDRNVVDEFLVARREVVGPTTLKRTITPLLALHDRAVDMRFIAFNPIPRGEINATKGRKQSAAISYPHASIMRWRQEGVLGLGSAREETMMMRERNLAYVDLLYQTGMRRLEGHGLFYFEVPSRPLRGEVLVGRIPGALSKGRPEVGRLVYLDGSHRKTIQDYFVGAREVDIAFGKKSGIYENDPEALIVKKVNTRDGIPNTVLVSRGSADAPGKWRKLDLIDLRERIHMYEIDEADGKRRPLLAWLGDGGKPLDIRRWNRIFREASARTERSDGTGKIDVHPHTLRHCFAMQLYIAAAMRNEQRRRHVSESDLTRIVNEMNAWKHVKDRLGHSNVETTMSHYLAPLQAMEYAQILARRDDAPSTITRTVTDEDNWAMVTSIDEAMRNIAQVDDRVIDA